MEPIQEDQSSSDNHNDEPCSQPQFIHSKNVVPTIFAELCDTEQSVDSTNSKIEKALTFSDKAVPAPVVVIPSANNHASQQPLEPSNDNNDRRGLLTRRRMNQRGRGINNDFKRFFDGIKPEPYQPDEYLSKISKDSPTITYGNKTISVDFQQFKDAPLLGEGGFGAVHLITSDALPRNCMAVKHILSRKNADGRSSADTELEIMEMIGIGNTPYIVGYYGSVVDPSSRQLCICMEYMDASLEKFYRHMHPLDQVATDMLSPLLHRIVHNITSALYFLENKGIVHHDIKPENMLINIYAVIKLCDFGISGNLNRQKEYSFAPGTIRYQAPNPEPCIIHNDMWALGMSLLEFINNIHPFANGIPFRIELWEPKIPTTISQDMQKLIRHLLKADSRDRPRSYINILNLPFIQNVPEIPSNEECNFVCHVLNKIRSSGNSNS